MRIAAIAESFNCSLKRATKKAKEMGFHGLQLYMKDARDPLKMTDRKIGKLINLFENNNLEITAFCGDFGGHGFMVESENRAKIEKIKKLSDIAKKMNVSIITTHIGIIPNDKSDPTYLVMKKAISEMGEYLYTNGVTLAIETGPEIATTLYDFIKDLRGVGVNLDPANFVMVTGQNPAEAVRLLGKFIVHTHAKDGIQLRKCIPEEVYGSIDPSKTHNMPQTPVFKETPLGEGGVDWDDYLSALREVGYDGYLTIERETHGRPEVIIKQAQDFLKDKLGYKKDKISVAVIGCGNIAKCAHFPSISALPQYELKYCVDIVLAKAENAVSRWGKPGYTKALTDYKEILEDEKLDAVIICTHTHLHSVMAIDCMLHGKHVLSEKPVAMSYAQAEEMNKVSIETGKICNIGVCNRFNGVVNEIKELIEKQELGHIYNVYCSFRQYRNIPGIGGEFTRMDKSGGGVLFDWGVHLLDLVLYCLDNPKLLSASCDTYGELGKDIGAYKNKNSYGGDSSVDNGIFDVEDYTTGLVRTKDMTLTFTGAWAQNVDKNEMYIDFLGSKKGIRLTYCGTFVMYDGNKEVKSTRNLKDFYFEEHVEFVENIITNSRGRASIEKVLPVAKLLEALYESAKQRKEIVIQN